MFDPYVLLEYDGWGMSGGYGELIAVWGPFPTATAAWEWQQVNRIRVASRQPMRDPAVRSIIRWGHGEQEDPLLEVGDE